MFRDKVAIVTGAASGIGKEISRALATRGAVVVLTDFNAETLAAAAAEIGGGCESHLLDVTDAGAVEVLVRSVAEKHGRIDFMFNNAGVALFGNTRDTSLEDWNWLIDVNIRGVVHGVMAAYPIMQKQGSGHIVNTASVAGLIPVPGNTAYAMTKHAVVGLSESLRSEARRYGVKVSAVCPGIIETPLVQTAKLVNIDREEAMSQAKLKLASPVDLAEAVMRGLERDKGRIVFTPIAHLAWRIYRLSPSIFDRVLDLLNKRNPMLPR